VLDAIVQLLEESPGGFFLGGLVEMRTGLDSADVERAVRALSRGYVILGREPTDERIELQWLEGVTAEARPVVGQWPTAESLAARMAVAFAEAADA
jgi:hypothetical protein